MPRQRYEREGNYRKIKKIPVYPGKSCEATDYLLDQELGLHLTDICKALLQLETNDAHAVLGSPDDLKLRSSGST